MIFWIAIQIFMTFYDWTIIDDAFRAGRMNERNVYSFDKNLINGFVVTLIGGVLIASVEVLYFSKLLRNKPFGIALLIKTIFYFGNIFFFTSLAVLLELSFRLERSLLQPEIIEAFIQYLSTPRAWSLWMFWGFSVMLALFILQVSEKLGQGVLLHFLAGKYHRPKEVERIFMFLDLRSSTTYAEKLGHVKYSELIQDCFRDLTDAVAKHQAQIYQYVGDEAVLLWKVKQGLKDQNCINCFSTYNQQIVRNKGKYLERYGMIPAFKAGLDMGRVTVAEVGEIKKELAYHGDVLNTASRITGRCNDLGAQILISERLKVELESNPGNNRFENIGEMELKGKKLPVNVFKVLLEETTST